VHVALHVCHQHLELGDAIAHRTAPHQHFRRVIGDCATIGEARADQAAQAAAHRRVAQAMPLRDGLGGERNVRVRPDARDHPARMRRRAARWLKQREIGFRIGRCRHADCGKSAGLGRHLASDDTVVRQHVAAVADTVRLGPGAVDMHERLAFVPAERGVGGLDAGLARRCTRRGEIRDVQRAVRWSRHDIVERRQRTAAERYGGALHTGGDEWRGQRLVQRLPRRKREVQRQRLALEAVEARRMHRPGLDQAAHQRPTA